MVDTTALKARHADQRGGRSRTPTSCTSSCAGPRARDGSQIERSSDCGRSWRLFKALEHQVHLLLEARNPLHGIHLRREQSERDSERDRRWQSRASPASRGRERARGKSLCPCSIPQVPVSVGRLLRPGCSAASPRRRPPSRSGPRPWSRPAMRSVNFSGIWNKVTPGFRFSNSPPYRLPGLGAEEVRWPAAAGRPGLALHLFQHAADR